MTKHIPALAAALALTTLLAAPAAAVEESSTREETLEFAAGSTDRVLRVCNITGPVSARGYGGSEVRLTVRETYRGDTREDLARAKERLGLRIEREGGAIDLAVGSRCGCRRDCRDDWNDHDDWDRIGARHELELQVPHGVRVELGTVNEGDVTLRDHRGDFRLSNVNGGISALDVAGSGTVSSVNGPLTVRFTENPRRETSFRNVNGKIDVTFPAGLAAELTFETLNGEVYTDLPLDDTAVTQASHDARKGKHRLKRSWRTRAAADGGGVELSFTTVNGDIYLRGPGG
jgi:hypothetical protein